MKTAPILLCALTLLLGACNSDPLVTPSPLKGTLHGRINLRDEYNTLLTDHRGVTVALEGTQLSGATDSSGFWTIENVPAGTYVLNYDRPGFGPWKMHGFQFVGNGDGFVPGRISLGANPTIGVANLQEPFRDSAHKHVVFEMTLSAAPPKHGGLLLLCLGEDSTVSAEPGHYLARVVVALHLGQVQQIGLSYNTPAIFGIPNRPMYAAAYVISGASSSYPDPYLGEDIYTALSPRSNPVRVMFP